MAPTLQVSFGGPSVFNGNKEVPSFSIGYDEILQLVQQQQTIETCLLHTMRHLRSDTETFEHLNNSLIGVRAHIERLYRCIPAIERPATVQSAAKAQEVFSTPELLEQIIMYLPTPEKLRAMGVQRCWHDGLNGSIKLKRSLGLAPFEKDTKNYYSAFSSRVNNPNSADWRLANSNSPIGYFEDQDWVASKTRGRVPQLDDSVESGPVDSTLKIRIISYSGTSLICGSRIRQMLLTSGPTLHELVPYMYCEPCKQRGFLNRAYVRLDPIVPESTSSFTIGDLADGIAALRAKHPKCSPVVELWGAIRLGSNDPIMIKRQEMYDRKLARRIQPTAVDDSSSESSDDSDSSDGGNEEESESDDESTSAEENGDGGTSDGDEEMREFSDDEEDEHEEVEYEEGILSVR